MPICAPATSWDTARFRTNAFAGCATSPGAVSPAITTSSSSTAVATSAACRWRGRAYAGRAPSLIPRNVLTKDHAAAALCDIERVAPGAEILVLGHTHRPMAFAERAGWLLREKTGAVSLPAGEAIVLNPGAVGQSRSRDASARLAVLDTSAREATFHAVPYDVAACRRALQDRGLPPQSCHVPRSRWDDIGAALAARLRRLVRMPARGS